MHVYDLPNSDFVCLCWGVGVCIQPAGVAGTIPLEVSNKNKAL